MADFLVTAANLSCYVRGRMVAMRVSLPALINSFSKH